MQIKLLLIIALIFLRINSFGQNSLNQISKTSKYKSLVIGIWTDGHTENASFEINNDSIYYVDSFQSFKYKITGDSIIIKFEGYDKASKIEKITKDSLILNYKGERRKFWKFKD